MITSHQGIDLLGLAKADFNFSRIMITIGDLIRYGGSTAPIPGRLMRDTVSGPRLIRISRWSGWRGNNQTVRPCEFKKTLSIFVTISIILGVTQRSIATSLTAVSSWITWLSRIILLAINAFFFGVMPLKYIVQFSGQLVMAICRQENPVAQVNTN